MDSSEFEKKIILMGWTPRRLGDELGVQPRTIRAWSKDRLPPADIADQVDEWWKQFVDLIQGVLDGEDIESDLPKPIQFAAEMQVDLFQELHTKHLSRR